MRSFLSTYGLAALLTALLALSPNAVYAQQQQQRVKAPEPTRIEVQSIAAKPEDVATLDGIMKAFYEVVSGPAGQPRQWARDRTLYIQGMRFVATGVRKGESKPYANIIDHQTFVDQSNDFMVRDGFYEREIHRVTRRFGNIAHIFSTYETRQKPDGPVTSRGVNSLELYYDGTRWWIASAVWDGERADNPIPKELLP
ncbi:MAG TPA: hypothetical protein VF708_01190 [Pyrinomonadaceae bacterium]|jgi:hypothetical protein